MVRSHKVVGVSDKHNLSGTCYPVCPVRESLSQERSDRRDLWLRKQQRKLLAAIYERPKTIPALYTFSPDTAHHLMNPTL